MLEQEIIFSLELLRKFYEKSDKKNKKQIIVFDCDAEKQSFIFRNTEKLSNKARKANEMDIIGEGTYGSVNL